MRVFVTGATGFIGSAVVRELLGAGHQVLGLARMGAEAHQGELRDLGSLGAGARACEAVIHLGFVHDSRDFPAAAETDREAITAIGDALANSGKVFVGTSGTMLLAPGRLGTEEDDAARLFRLALERGVAGARFHGVGEEGIAFRDLAEVIGRRLEVPAMSKSLEEAAGHFGPLHFVVSADNPTSNARTREQLGWNPGQPGLIADLDGSH